MESNNKNSNNNYEQGEQQLRKRKFNELANGGQSAAEGEQKQQQSPENLSKKNCDGQQGNDALENLHLESLSREELINLVRKQEAVKKEAEESANAKQQAKEMAIKMEDLQMALLASQQKVEELTAENMEHRKHLDSSKQAEDFSQRIVQLEQEKAEIQEDLRQKMAEILDIHKEVDEKSVELAEKAKQIDALLIQLKESTSHQHQIALPMPTEEQEMKIKLSLETWYDWLANVPRPRLGQIVAMIGDRKFASIVQKFLHEYGEIEIDQIQIVAPYEDPSGHPRVRVWQNNSYLRFEMAEMEMPANIKTFKCIKLSYLDQSVLNFMQKFQQNGLLDNVNLLIDKLSLKGILQPILCHLLPLINGIVSIILADSAHLVDFYDAGNSKEIYELNMKMMKETRFLAVNYYDLKSLQPNKIDLYCRWLYQPARADGKSRMLFLSRKDVDYSPIFLFIDRLKQDFLMATDPITFFIQIGLPKAFQPPEAICLDNDKTKERFQTKMEEDPYLPQDKIRLAISRLPLASTNKWIVGKEYYAKIIYLWNDLKFVPT